MNINKQNKHNKHNKYGKRIFSMLLAFVFMVTLLPPQKVNAVGRTPIDMMKDGRSNYWRWDLVSKKNDIPDDGKWHRMLLFFQYDTMDKKAHYLSGDATFKNEAVHAGELSSIVFPHYENTATAAGDLDVDLSDNQFFTETHRNGFFVKRVGYSAYDDNILVKIRTSDSKGNPSQYIGDSLVDSESNALTFKMMTSDSTEWIDRVGEGEIKLWGLDEIGYFALSDLVNFVGIGAEHMDGIIGVCGMYGSFERYMKMKMYIGEPFTETYITTDFKVNAGENQTLSGETLIQPNVTVTVEEGGTLAISGALYNAGTINNNGTIVFNRDSTLGYHVSNGGGGDYYDTSAGIAGTDFNCKGNSSLIICEGAKLILPKGLKMAGNSVCHNSGAMIFEDGLKMSGNATFYNRNIGLIESGGGVGGRYYELKKYRPIIRSRQESTIQGVGGNIPLMKYWAYIDGVSLMNAAEGGYIYYYPKKWFDIGSNTKFYNEGTVNQYTFIYTDKGVNWCEGNPPEVGHLRWEEKSKDDYARARDKVNGVEIDDDGFGHHSGTYYEYDENNELDYNFIIPYK